MNATADTVAGAAPNASGASLRVPRVAVLEDDPDQAMLVKRRLERGGFEPVVFDRVGAFLEAAPSAIDLVLLDWWLPDMGGDAAVKAVRKSQPPGVPVIFVSARNGEEEQVEMLDLGADDVLVKPLTREQLLLTAASYTGMLPGPSDYALDESAHHVFENGELRVEDAADFALARVFIHAPGRLQMSAHLSRALGEQGLEAEPAAVDASIARLRDRLGWNQPGRWRLESVLRRGYRFTPPPAGL